jgi:hypothetical protein
VRRRLGVGFREVDRVVSCTPIWTTWTVVADPHSGEKWSERHEHVAKQLAEQILVNLEEGEPGADAIDAMERLSGTPQASLFCLSPERLHEAIEVGISDAFFDRIIILPAATIGTADR